VIEEQGEIFADKTENTRFWTPQSQFSANISGFHANQSAQHFRRDHAFIAQSVDHFGLSEDCCNIVRQVVVPL
jgi:hypothetical protein